MLLLFTQGKSSRALARELEKYVLGDAKGGAKYNAERLMRTELARVQTEAQKQSFERNGFGEYTFLANSNCCEHCKDKDGKHFKVKDMMPGLNAPPMHPHCRCSTAAYKDSDDYEAWLDFLSKGGTTVEWEKMKTVNMAKAIDSMTLMNDANSAKYTREQILKEMQTSPVGLDTIRAIRDTNAKITIFDAPRRDGVRGDQSGDNIRIFSSNIQSIRVAAQTLIHEMAHYRFDIGGCQHAEAVCFAMEKMHILGRNYLTESGKRACNR